MYSDYTGLPLSTDSQEAAEAYQRTVDAYLRFARDTGEHLKRALKADPGMIMANCLMGYFLHLMGTRALLSRAEKSLTAALASAAQATPRERAHTQALRHWCNGDLRAAVEVWEKILLEHPHDIVALKVSHYTHFYLGDSAKLLDSTARVLPAWDERMPGYGYVLGMRAFGLEETGDYRTAEDLGRRAVDLNPADAWGIHAVAHVMEMQDRHRQGIDWISDLEPHWSQANNFRYHLVWHRALMRLDRGDYDAVLADYDERLWDPESNEYLDLCNDASLLLRLEIAGIDVGQRWQALVEKVEPRIDDHILVFIDAHFMMVLAAAGRSQAAATLLDSQRALSAAQDNTTAALTAEIGLPLCEGLLAYRQGSHARAVNLLYPIRHRIKTIGGSHAQRDVFDQVLIDAACKAERWPLAQTLLAERVAHKPDNPWSWQRYALALAKTGDELTAQPAQARAGRLRT